MASTDAITFPAKSHTHTKSQITDFPSALKNPNSLTLKTNGTTKITYNGASAATLDITPSVIGAASSSHSHTARYYDISSLVQSTSPYSRDFLVVWPELHLYYIHIFASFAATAYQSIALALPIYPASLTNVAFSGFYTNTAGALVFRATAVNIGYGFNSNLNKQEPQPVIEMTSTLGVTPNIILCIDHVGAFTEWNTASPVFNTYATI